jgi:hypothetical protein
MNNEKKEKVDHATQAAMKRIETAGNAALMMVDHMRARGVESFSCEMPVVGHLSVKFFPPRAEPQVATPKPELSEEERKAAAKEYENKTRYGSA